MQIQESDQMNTYSTDQTGKATPPRRPIRDGFARLAVATAVAIPTVVALADVADARIAVNHNECVGRDT